MKLDIKNNCEASWDDMTHCDNGKFCNTCVKKVYNFAQMGRDEIILFMLKNQDKKICARIDKSNSYFSNAEIINVIEKELPKHKSSNYGFYLLLIASLNFLGCNNDEAKTVENNITLMESPQHCEKDSGIKTLKGNLHTHIPINPPMGVILNNNNTDTNSVYTNVEKLPSFKTGVDDFFKYINDNLNYPEWELKNKIEGRVIISFVVEKDGSLSDIKILRIPKESKNLGNEAFRIVKKMPRWIPAENNNKVVRSYYVIPVIFKIDNKKNPA